MKLSDMHQQIRIKAQELDIPEEAIICALEILSSNRNLVNALDNKTEMDEYIYRAIIKEAIDKRKSQAERDVDSTDENARLQAEKDLSLLSREEMITDAYYRAILPIISKMVMNEPILRLHADVAVDIVTQLANCKRKLRITSLTEVIIMKCKAELEFFNNPENIFEPELAK